MRTPPPPYRLIKARKRVLKQDYALLALTQILFKISYLAFIHRIYEELLVTNALITQFKFPTNRFVPLLLLREILSLPSITHVKLD